ncbi:type I glyceraldehyde-3-phosphate dehydrogenase [Halapricum hydrolyticum]|uniref:glyceraldehyde-3-phosphate dehydrogenase (NAD(P)(+)) (phosphorylating) n=1 Tax=Halapricum hydrolyticum TaxID=2979991 RepID=A0AAE3LIF3_9EURY|nr:type I glyceraldehyde-3-phosphate dehydrogenase [Halapricum hydrolyticum]MCU4718848.1 type I glyceraldehyde-3-phosphate dehydrogenase [Halapricum hydrolyticum]MCU4727874.1 type I glyceraldehyde-3-phosphate dehydrogenase [Halapricum hydrolyticum]
MSASDTVRIGINGFGRIGRCTFRAALNNDDVEIVGINDVMSFEQMEYLSKYDTTLGNLPYDVSLDGDTLSVGENDISLYNIQSPEELPWDDLDVDVAIESTGIFRTKDEASAHLDAGADKALISAPPKGDKPVPQFVYGVNHDEYDGEDIVSGASCTTNSVSPPMYVLLEEFGVNAAEMTTIHAYTGSQNIVDGPKSKTRRGRAAAENIVPTTTGASTATTDILPDLKGKFEAMAIRVPTPSGSITEIVADLEGNPSAEEINDAMREYANGELEGAMGATDDEIVSRDILGWEYGSCVDLKQTSTVEGGDLAKIFAWYDNEMGYTAQMMRLAEYIA